MRNIYLKTKSLEEVKKLIDENFQDFYRLEIEEVDVRDCLSRVAAEEVYSIYSSPSFHSCAMDGVMVESDKTLTAREHRPLVLGKEDFSYCDTGDPLIKPYDAVIMIEDIVELDEGISIQAPIHPWENVRPIGEDIIERDLIFPQFHKFKPIDLSVMLSAGLSRIKVIKKPRVAIIPTGDEIVSSSKDLKIGQIIESNSAMFVAMVDQIGGQADVFPIVKDDKEVLKNTVRQAIKAYDIVLMNAGSSAGRDDYTASIAKELGNLIVHGISIKPGKPAVIASIEGKPFVGLPGYPVSAHVVFQEVIKPLLEKKMRLKKKEDSYVKGALTRPVISSLKNTEYVRVKLGKVKDKLYLTPLDRGAGSSYSLSQSDGYLIIPRNSEGYLKDETVKVRLHDYIDEADFNNRIVSIGSHDMVLDIINDLFAKEGAHYSLLSSHVGSFSGLKALMTDNCHIAPSHLLGKDGKYNNEAVGLLFKEQEMAMINVVGRRQGFIVEKGNPKKIKSIQDIVDLKMANRQRGAGTRVLFDYLLEKEGIKARDIHGYDYELTTHLAAALAVKNHDVDFAIGVESAAIKMGLDFVYLADEDYEFVLRRESLDLKAIRDLLEMLRSDLFRETVKKLGGYNVSRSGEVRYYEG
ncbi:MAG: molybdopterin biosynthesis protein [Tissierellia bacterium]|nr:molybdopterin biosynthesis protein [Tissierellia bacterium]